jgi:hypothetical protein
MWERCRTAATRPDRGRRTAAILINYDPTQDGAGVAFKVMDRMRSEMLHRVGFSDLLTPAQLA